MNDSISPNQKTVEAVLEFWFGKPVGAFHRRWFRKDPDFDADIRRRFSDTYWRLIDTEISPWLQRPRDCLALILLFDQFARNMFRNTPQSFAADPLALAAAQGGLAQNYDQLLLPVERFFMYLPLEHSENLHHQHLAVSYFEKLAQIAPELSHGLDYARRHREYWPRPASNRPCQAQARVRRRLEC